MFLSNHATYVSTNDSFMETLKLSFQTNKGFLLPKNTAPFKKMDDGVLHHIRISSTITVIQVCHESTAKTKNARIDAHNQTKKAVEAICSRGELEQKLNQTFEVAKKLQVEKAVVHKAVLTLRGELDEAQQSLDSTLAANNEVRKEGVENLNKYALDTKNMYLE
ncbi:hypothetical protein CsSME_00015874 [Camellia sinensis var. sinensis]|uniref:uncharacterized protein LOC114299650 n=1 Tax=Camellia sinensis TaxID=4442 RepID=UPI0010364C91|nr:uncharacterized protein LOC114299650 [Camellia sinensis]XP_028100241.1 uncharacterized protein LOC114299650 [Camellia sinensis]